MQLTDMGTELLLELLIATCEPMDSQIQIGFTRIHFKGLVSRTHKAARMGHNFLLHCGRCPNRATVSSSSTVFFFQPTSRHNFLSVQMSDFKFCPHIFDLKIGAALRPRKNSVLPVTRSSLIFGIFVQSEKINKTHALHISKKKYHSLVPHFSGPVTGNTIFFSRPDNSECYSYIDLESSCSLLSPRYAQRTMP